MKTRIAMLGSVTLALFMGPAWATTYDIDPAHSEVGFKVRHMMVGRTTGRFAKFAGAFEYDEKDPKSWSTRAVIAAASVDTDNEKRDEHLRGEDFFDARKHPDMEFVSIGVRGWKAGRGRLVGRLTLHGVTKEVILDLEANGTTADPWGVERAGFTARGKIDRRDFGIVWNKALDRGGVAVGNDVEIALEIEGIKRKTDQRTVVQ